MKTNKNILRRSKENGIELIQQYHEDCISTLEAINIYKKSKNERLKDIQRNKTNGLPYEHYQKSFNHCNNTINRLYKRLEWQQSYISNYQYELKIENALESIGFDNIQVNDSEVSFMISEEGEEVFTIYDIDKYDLNSDTLRFDLLRYAETTFYSCCGDELDPDFMICPSCGEHC